MPLSSNKCSLITSDNLNCKHKSAVPSTDRHCEMCVGPRQCSIGSLQIVIVDEIGSEAEALACRTIAERGVQLIGTAHGQLLENLLKNPTLSDLVGGVESVTLGMPSSPCDLWCSALNIWPSSCP